MAVERCLCKVASLPVLICADNQQTPFSGVAPHSVTSGQRILHAGLRTLLSCCACSATGVAMDAADVSLRGLHADRGELSGASGLRVPFQVLARRIIDRAMARARGAPAGSRWGSVMLALDLPFASLRAGRMLCDSGSVQVLGSFRTHVLLPKPPMHSPLSVQSAVCVS